MPQSTLSLPKTDSPRFRLIRDEGPDDPYDAGHEATPTPKREPVVMVSAAVGETVLGTLGPAAFAVYWHLSKRSRDGQCWPSLDDIAEATTLSRMHVTRMLNALEKDGWITRTKRANSYGMSTSTLYTITVKDRTDGCNTTVTSHEHDGPSNVTRTSGELVVNQKENVKTAPKKSNPETPVPENLVDIIPPDVWAAMRTETRLTDDQLRYETALMIDRNLTKEGRSRNWIASWRNWLRSPYRKSQPIPAGSLNGAMPPEIKALPHNNADRLKWENDQRRAVTT